MHWASLKGFADIAEMILEKNPNIELLDAVNQQ